MCCCALGESSEVIVARVGSIAEEMKVYIVGEKGVLDLIVNTAVADAFIVCVFARYKTRDDYGKGICLAIMSFILSMVI